MMPEHSYSVECLLEFHKNAGMEGLINPAVARSRRKAVELLAAGMTETERADIRTLDVDQLASRFHKLEESSIRNEALSLYAERFSMARSDFLAWTDDPASFQSIGGERQRALARGSLSPEHEMAERLTLEATHNPANIIPIALRPDETVYIANLPLDLTVAEAERIARVLRAFAACDEAGAPEADS